MTRNERLEQKIVQMEQQAQQLAAQVNAIAGAISFAKHELQENTQEIDWSKLSDGITR